jgi:hypothetical protein
MRSIAAVIAVLCLLTSCGVEPKDAYTRVRSDRSPLMEGFFSYSARAEIEAQLKIAGLQYSVDEEYRLAANDPRPTYEVVGITVQRFRHLNQSGTLTLSFFNNRLSETRFFPADPEAYLGALRKAGIQVSEQRTRNGNTELWTHQASDVRYIGWADRRLHEEHSRWIRRYS